jgi:hypothetical protein
MEVDNRLLLLIYVVFQGKITVGLRYLILIKPGLLAKSVEVIGKTL